MNGTPAPGRTFERSAPLDGQRVVPCTSSQARTQREHTMHLEGESKYGLEGGGVLGGVHVVSAGVHPGAVLSALAPARSTRPCLQLAVALAER